MIIIDFYKNRYKIISFSLLFITNAFGQKTDWQRDNLQGKVKSIIFYTNSKPVKFRTYNVLGFETSLKNYCTNNTLKICSQDSSIYNSTGNMVKCIDDNFVIEKKYDDANNLLESIISNKVSKKIFDKVTFSYFNSKKTRSEQTKYVHNSTLVEFNIVINYLYDASGYLIQEDNTEILNGKKTLKTTTIYKYNNNHNLIAKTENSLDGTIRHSYIYKYDNFDRKVEYISRSINESSYTNYNEYFKYDEKNRLIESGHIELDGKTLYKDLYYFDNMGNQIKRSHYYYVI